jgi:hypothetical protein
MDIELDSRAIRSSRVHEESPYLNTAQAGLYMRLSGRTLETMRSNGGGPPYREHGGRICYHIDELDAWSAARRRRSITEKKAAPKAPPKTPGRRKKRRADH